jgi:hypothetical protein
LWGIGKHIINRSITEFKQTIVGKRAFRGEFSWERKSGGAEELRQSQAAIYQQRAPAREGAVALVGDNL